MGIDPFTIAAGATIGSTLLGAKGAKDAAKAQAGAAREGVAAQQQMLERTLETTQPFRDVGLSAADPLQQLLFQPRQQISLPGKEILDNPLLKSIQDDVTQRLFANRASRGILGAGGTGDALFSSLAPTALNLGLSLQSAQEAQKQQQIQNLFNLLGLGANVSAGQGTAIQQTGQGVAQALQNAGSATAAGRLGSSQAIQQGIGDIAGLSFLNQGGFFRPPQGFQDMAGFRPTVGGTEMAGPLMASGRFN